MADEVTDAPGGGPSEVRPAAVDEQSEAPMNGAPVVDPPAAPTESDEEAAARRARRAERERERRAKKAARAEKAKAKAPAAADDKPATKPATKAQAAADAEKERVLRLALSGTFEGLASTVALGVAGVGAPGLGTARADTLAKLWAPVLAPYLDDDTSKWLPVVLASGVTVATGTQFAAELRAYKRDKEAEQARKEATA